jgi:DNA-binding transcriptional ArsR family regulator
MMKAAASSVRVDILQYLKDPETHFPAQIDGNPIRDGIPTDLIRQKLGISTATVSRHLALLTDAGLLIATRKKDQTFYRRDEKNIERFVKQFKFEL